MPTPVEDQNKAHLITLLRSFDKVVCSEVVAVGPGDVTIKGKEVPMEYSVGDVVYYPTECQDTSPKFTDPEGNDYLVIHQAQVLCYKPAVQ